ncbi:hypothetical protein [Petroclostridium sp. X23]|uniref:hypothetical protein n=1 Tax=Petroclostridium sp. X23 TaxID=3045146 RepID=UPI0024ADB89E|nr:hypothetical protein [Petroclostridium sp. X23]WHH56921.1 hypothetical protein QKW49_13785 [Petroclostridium sp. X23]
MKKIKLMLASGVLALSIFTMGIVVDAASIRQQGISSCGASYNSSTGKVAMKSMLKSGKSASNIKEIQARGDYYRNGNYLDSVETDTTGGYSSATASYSANAYTGSVYEVEGSGYYIMSSLPNNIYYDFSSVSYVYNSKSSSNLVNKSIVSESIDLSNSKNELEMFYKNLDEHIASTFDIALNDYQKVNISNLGKTEENAKLVKTYLSIPKESGDKKPSIYLKNDSEGFIIMQKADGTNKIYYLELSKSKDWVEKSDDSVKGKLVKFNNEEVSKGSTKVSKINNGTEIVAEKSEQ